MTIRWINCFDTNGGTFACAKIASSAWVTAAIPSVPAAMLVPRKLDAPLSCSDAVMISGTR